MTAREEAKDATAIDIVKIGGILAALSVLIVFLVSFGSAIFARGLLISLGFAPSSIGVKAAADMFAIISYRQCFMFILFGLIGFIPWPRHWLPNQSHIVLSLGVIVFVMIVMKIETASDTHSTFGLAFFEVATLIAPTIVGYSLLSVKSVARYPLAIVASMVVLLAFGTNIRSIALVEAEKVKRADVNEEMVSVGTSQSTPIRDFGVVTIISKEQLEFLPGGLKIDGAYEYGPQPTAFLRLITEDDSNYFIIEKSGVKVVPVTVRKEAVIAVMFRNASVTAGQVPSTNP